MSATRAKKVKMATKSCPECDQQVPVACKSCPCGYIFISRKLLNAKHPEKSPSSTENKHEAKRRRTERVRREKINSTVNKDLENRKRSRSNSHSDHIRRGRGRPKSASAKKHEEERAAITIIYLDLISHDELFSDIYKIREIADQLCLEMEGKMVSRTKGNIDDSVIGGNASTKGPEGEGTKSTVITGVDVVVNHHLQETSFTKEAYKKYIKDYMKSIKGKLEEQRDPERVKAFMTGAAEPIKHILANFKNLPVLYW
uniref:TCTP domain-containing protein n=1 Tax=Catagonus wagneri TaxID=51154 RepID=A0A8C3VK39_9CETA